MFKLYLGPVRSAKTSSLIMKYDLLTSLGEKAIVFKPQCDDRRGTDNISTYKGFKVPAISISSVYDMAKHIFNEDGQTVVGYVFIDEIQFFSKDIYGVIVDFIRLGINIYASGLNSTFELLPWETVTAILPLASAIVICHGKCVDCHGKSTCSGQSQDRKAKKGVDIGDHFVPLCIPCYLKRNASI